MTAILVVDDNSDDLEQIEDLLRQLDPDVQVTCCEGGASCADHLEKADFECVILDLHLDGEDGIDVLTKIHEQKPALPVIILTGQGSEQAATRAFVAGAAFYLPKHGLEPAPLWAAVQRVIRHAENKRELQAQREALERSNRLDAVGQLAAGIAHDINNQLGTLRLSVELLKNAVATDQGRRHINTCLTVIGESTRLASRLISLSRQGDLLSTSVSVQQTLEDLRALALVSMKYGDVLTVECVDDDMGVHCDSGQFLNALLNLVLNANAAIASQGRSGKIQVAATQDSNKIKISIKDNGVGMKKEVLEKCIDPFYTTKEGRNGIGLGLSMAQSFVNDSKGALIINSEIGVGTEVIIELPSFQVSAQKSRNTSGKPENSSSSVSIVLVEDNALLGITTKEVLEEAGFAVNIFPNALGALDYFARRQKVDILLTDVKMAGMNGFELGAKVREKWPSVQIIYLTGYADNPEHEGQVLLGPVLQKPVDPDRLIKKIHSVLAVKRNVH